jgi:small nuclear ribonucleoprotein (snRNP)-like protein
MKALLVTCMLAVSVPASAQAVPTAPAGEIGTSSDCWPTAHIDRVVVELGDGSTQRGTLLCFGETAFTVLQKSSVVRYPLADVKRVRKSPDGVLDGAAKGAAVGLIMLVLCGGDCTAGEYLRVTTAYALFGLAVDAADSHMDTIYRPSAGKRAALGFRVPF